MPSLVCFDTTYPIEGEGFAKEFAARLQFFADFCSVPVTVALRERVNWLTRQKPSWSSCRARSTLIYTNFHEIDISKPNYAALM